MMKLDKRAAELTMNTIIIAALAVILLIVLAFIFKDQIGNASRQYNSASKNTASCLENPDSDACKLFKGTSTNSQENRYTTSSKSSYTTSTTSSLRILR